MSHARRCAPSHTGGAPANARCSNPGHGVRAVPSDHGVRVLRGSVWTLVHRGCTSAAKRASPQASRRSVLAKTFRRPRPVAVPQHGSTRRDDPEPDGHPEVGNQGVGGNGFSTPTRAPPQPAGKLWEPRPARC